MNSPSDALSALREAEHLPVHGHDEKWLRLTKALYLPGGYVVAVKEVLQNGRVRAALSSGAVKDKVAFVRRAASYKARESGLQVDRLGEPYVPTKDTPKAIRLTGDAALKFQLPYLKRGNIGTIKIPIHLQEAISLEPRSRVGFRDPEIDRHRDRDNGVYESHVERLMWRAQEKDLYAESEPSRYDEVPDHLRPIDIEGEIVYGAVDWEKVARSAVEKPRMAPAVARVLKSKADGQSCAEAVKALDSKERRETVNAWKWVEVLGAVIQKDRMQRTPPLHWY